VISQPLQTVLDALERHGRRYRHSGDQVDAQCPAHDDHSPSLSVRWSRDTGKVLIRCHQGCSADDVIVALGLTWAELFERRDGETTRQRGKRSEIVAVYDYADEHGEVLFQKVRYFPKRFVQRRPDGRGGWSYNLNGVRRVPYMLPLLMDAVATGKPVLVCEGEKDCDRAFEKLGVVATTNPEGAAKAGDRPKWRPEYTSYFAGADVIVVADNDDAGIAHGRAVADALKSTAAMVRLVKPALEQAKADLSDHLDAGYGLDELVRLDDEAAPSMPAGTRTLRVTKASDITSLKWRWLWNRWLPLGVLSLIAGREGLGKSTITCDLCAQVTQGALDGELRGQPRNVLYVASEDDRARTIVPRLTAAGADLHRVLFVDVQTDISHDAPLVLPLDNVFFQELIQEHDVALVVLDAATSVMDSRLNGHVDREVRQFLEPLKRLAENTSCAVLGIVHFGKRDGSDTGKLILGSAAWSQVPRSVLAVALDEDSGRIIVSNTKKNLTGDSPSLAARIVSQTVQTADGPTSVGRVEWLGETTADARDFLRGQDLDDERTERDEAKVWLEEYLTATMSAKSAEVKKAARLAGFSDRTLARARRELRVQIRDEGFPRVTYWSLPAGDSVATARDSGARAAGTTAPTSVDPQKQDQSDVSRDSGASQTTYDLTGDVSGPNTRPVCGCGPQASLLGGRCNSCRFPPADDNATTGWSQASGLAGEELAC
jgi:hypothetical protein